MPNTTRSKLYAAERYFLLFVFVSFLGWFLETIFCSLDLGRFCDRGFMTLPFCTIYGFTVLGVYALIGTPDRGGILLRDISQGPVRLMLYFLLGALITTAVELSVGWFFTRICGISLWDYSGYRFNYKGYICLEFSILWGILIVLGMKYLFGPLKRSFGRLPEKWLLGISAVLAVLLVTDWGVNYIKILFR